MIPTTTHRKYPTTFLPILLYSISRDGKVFPSQERRERRAKSFRWLWPASFVCVETFKWLGQPSSLFNVKTTFPLYVYIYIIILNTRRSFSKREGEIDGQTLGISPFPEFVFCGAGGSRGGPCFAY